MNYGFNEAQTMLQRSIRDILEKESPIARVREVEASATGHDAALWRRLGELGLLELGLPGAGGSFVDALIFAEELGRTIAPAPFVSSIVVGASLLSSIDEFTPVVDELIAGDSVVSFAVNEAAALYSPACFDTAASKDGVWRVSGEKRFVEDAAAAGSFLVVANIDGVETGLFLVKRDAVEIEMERTVAGDFLGIVRFTGAPAEPVLIGPNSWRTISEALGRARIAHAAKIAGMAATSLRLAIDYAKTRIQFGRPIGSFQSLQHRLADLTTSLEATRFLTYHAGWVVDQGQQAEVSSAMALHSAVDLAEQLSIETAHIFGGYGVSVDTDIQLYYRRLRAAEVRWGDSGQLLEDVAAVSLVTA